MGELNRIGVRANAAYYRETDPWSPVIVAEEDWDVLIVLDACRYDTFEQLNPLPGTLKRRHSVGSESREYFVRNFSGREFHDIVYVTSNPWITKVSEGTFHDVRHVYTEGWDPGNETILPSEVTKQGIETIREFPSKRIVVHYMQPHAPYIGERGQKIPHQKTNNPDEYVRSIWANLQYGLTDTTVADVREAYRENLEIVLDSVRELWSEVDEKVVVTSDHGEMLGDRLSPIPVRGYGHLPRTPLPPLREIPWLELPYETRRTIRADPPLEATELSEDMVNERLRHLGYLDAD